MEGGMTTDDVWKTFFSAKMCLGVKKIPVVPVPDRPYFFLPTLLFFQRD
jgi:hypothetical protein